MRYLVAAALLCFSLSALAADQSHEETVVRIAYAKLSYAVDLETAYRLVLANPDITTATLTQKVAQQGLRFKLSNFAFGDLADITSQKFAAVFPQYPDGSEIIHLTEMKEQFTEDSGKTLEMDVAAPKWATGPTGHALDLTVAQMLPILEQESGEPSLVSYCTFTVTATLTGRSRTYKASFFFGPNGQAIPSDTVVGLGGGSLWDAMTKPVYPNVLLETSLWTKSAAAQDYILANQKLKDTCKNGEACCDAATLQCGVYSADLIGRRP